MSDPDRGWTREAESDARIVLVRHGHVEGIHPPRFRGRTDLPLTEQGLKEATATRDYLATFVSPAAIYASPLSRCMRTGEIIGQPGSCDVRPLPEFNDIDYGDWQGRTYDDVRATAPKAFTRWFATPHRTTFPGGETFHGVASRVANVLQMVRSEHAGQTVILVGHDSVNRLLLLLALERPLSRYWSLRQSPCGVSVLELRADSLVIASMNETAHLGFLSGRSR